MEWPLYPLEKLTDPKRPITYGVVKPGPEDPENGVKFIRGGDIFEGKLAIDSLRTITPEISKTYSRTLLSGGELVVSLVGNPGHVAVVPKSLAGANLARQAGLVALRPEINADFVKYFLMSSRGRAELLSQMTGSVQIVINLANLRTIRVPLPPLPIQRRISGILSAYDDLIENSQRRIKILEEIARSLYREWFVNFRYPGHESVQLVPSPLGKIPQGWEVKALNDVCSRITDGSHFSPPSVEDGFPMASVKDMHDWGINVESCRKIKVEDYEALVRNDCKPLKHDVLIAKDGSYLKHTFVVQEEQDLVVLSSIAMLRPNDSIRPNVLCFALRDPETKARMKGIVSGVAIPRIVLKDFRKFQILVPSTVVQAEWSRIVDPIGEACEKLISQVQNLRRTRDLLLPRLLSGQIDVESIDLQT